MCEVCEKLEGLESDDALQVIGEAFAEGAIEREHMNEVLDKILGFDKPPEEDLELAAEYERSVKRKPGADDE
jgi:hypothetical protein